MIEKYKTYLEFALLVVATIYGTIFIYRSWPYPSADFDVKVINRISTQSDFDNLVVKNNFIISDAANMDNAEFTYGCKYLDNKPAECEVVCSEVVVNPENGLLSKNDGLHWSCHYKIPKNFCMIIEHSVSAESFSFISMLSKWGVANIFGLEPKRSYWKTSAISCPVPNER